ncbi:MAG: hypothetical protein K9K65_10160 [Desulfarculaceae bacterium]|nr:hypothetical protein [Desulfarculaceae bacterium]MCF8048592.1 hypothetical protein [Desulfarculaceae bacterium]MCF8065389.1 hypothetical protein [Desulfarculaceae bacterium]MCF8098194.1 hypothetical protein [Desulfarculaceae bacterium]MCF8123188.1 hypothetical protein [Desulfarculaceae bacterium]
MRSQWQRAPLILAGVLCLTLALLHLEIIIMGAPAYLYFGAGRRMADLAEQGSWLPGMLTAAIALLLGIIGAYAFAGSGIIRRLPWLRPILLGSCALFLARGSLMVPQALSLLSNGGASGKEFSFSLVSLVLGLSFAWGLCNRWRLLTR